MFGDKPDKRCVRFVHCKLQNLAERVREPSVERQTCLQIRGCTLAKTQISPKWINRFDLIPIEDFISAANILTLVSSSDFGWWGFGWFVAYSSDFSCSNVDNERFWFKEKVIHNYCSREP